MLSFETDVKIGVMEWRVGTKCTVSGIDLGVNLLL